MCTTPEIGGPPPRRRRQAPLRPASTTLDQAGDEELTPQAMNGSALRLATRFQPRAGPQRSARGRWRRARRVRAAGARAPVGWQRRPPPTAVLRGPGRRACGRRAVSATSASPARAAARWPGRRPRSATSGRPRCRSTASSRCRTARRRSGRRGARRGVASRARGPTATRAGSWRSPGRASRTPSAPASATLRGSSPREERRERIAVALRRHVDVHRVAQRRHQVDVLGEARGRPCRGSPGGVVADDPEDVVALLPVAELLLEAVVAEHLAVVGRDDDHRVVGLSRPRARRPTPGRAGRRPR